MPAYPGRLDVHVDRPLTNVSIAYIQDAADFIAGEAAPIIPVLKQSDRYFVYKKDDWFRDEAAVRPPESESAGGGYTIDNTPNYFADVWAYHKDVDDYTAANSDVPLRPYEDATQFVTQKLLLGRERVWVNNFFHTGVWGTDAQGVNTAPSAGQFLQWDQATSTPITDVDNAKGQILSQTGYEPNTLVVSYPVFIALKNNPSILDRVKYTQRAVVTEDLLAALFGVKKFLVAKAVINSAKIGATNSFGFLFGNAALLEYVATNPGIKTPSAAYTFAWTGVGPGGGTFGNIVRRFRIERIRSDRVEGEMSFDLHLTGADLGYFFYEAIA